MSDKPTANERAELLKRSIEKALPAVRDTLEGPSPVFRRWRFDIPEGERCREWAEAMVGKFGADNPWVVENVLMYLK